MDRCLSSSLSGRESPVVLSLFEDVSGLGWCALWMRALCNPKPWPLLAGTQCCLSADGLAPPRASLRQCPSVCFNVWGVPILHVILIFNGMMCSYVSKSKNLECKK